MKSTRTSGVLAGVFLGLVLFLGLILNQLQEESPDVRHSVASYEADGRRAAFLLLEELGFEPEAWRKPPGALPFGEHVLWLSRPRLPGSKGPGETDESWEELFAEEGDQDQLLGGQQDPRGYERFVAQGGTLVIPLSTWNGEFLTHAVNLPAAGDLVLDETGAMSDPEGRAELTLETGERLVVDGSKVRSFQAPDPGHPAETQVATETGDPAVLRMFHGQGEVIALASMDFLDNDSIGEVDHALFLVRLAEDLEPGGRLLFDEFALGLWEPDSATGLAFSSGMRALTIHVLLLALLIVWRQSWSRQFPRDPEPLERVSPLARAEAGAALLERAGRFDLAARLLRRGVLNKLSRRMKLTSKHRDRAFDCSLDSLAESDETAAGPWEEFASEELRRIAERSGHPEAALAWSEVFVSSPPRTAKGLQQLSGDLKRIEATILSRSEDRRTFNPARTPVRRTRRN